MSAMNEHVGALDQASSHRSRRALLAGAIGGVGAWLAAAASRIAPAEAAAGDQLVIGSQTNNAGTSDTQLITNSSVIAFKLLQNGPGTALMGYATPTLGATRGVYGRSDSPSGFGIQGRNAGTAGTGAAIQGIGVNNDGVVGSTEHINRVGVKGMAGGGVGVLGQGQVGVKGTTTSSGYGVIGETAGEGAIGVAGVVQDPAAEGVRGRHEGSGVGVYAFSASGVALSAESQGDYAGQFTGPVNTNRYLDISEMTAPGNPPANTARLFVRDNGSKTELCVLFPTGSIQVIKTQV